MPHMSDFRFSSQSLQDYLECQRRFELRYIQNWLPPRKAAPTSFWSISARETYFTRVDQYFQHLHSSHRKTNHG